MSFHNEVYSKTSEECKGDVLMIPLWGAKWKLIIIQFRKKRIALIIGIMETEQNISA